MSIETLSAASLASRPPTDEVCPSILFVNHTSRMGGAEFVLLDLLPRFAGRCSVRLFEDGALRHRIEAAGIPVSLPARGDAFGAIKRDRTLWRALPHVGDLLAGARSLATEARRYDLVYANSQKAFVLAALATAIACRPLIWHLHDILSPGHFGRAQIRLGTTLANARASAVLVPSQAAAEAFIRAGGAAGLVRVVPNGVASPSLGTFDRVAARRALGLPDGFLFGVFSRLSPWKGQDRALRVLVDLPDAACVIAGGALFGEDGYANGLRHLAEELGIAPRVHFLGHRDDVPGLMRLVDAVVHPSVLPEPFGRTLVEAMLAGTPVVAADTGAAGEILAGGAAGLLVPPGDVAALVAALRRLMADPALRRSLVEAGTARAAEHYSIAHMTDGASRVVHEAVRRRKDW